MPYVIHPPRCRACCGPHTRLPSKQYMLFGSPLARKVLADKVLSRLRTAALKPRTGTATGANGSVVALAAAAARVAGA